MKRKKRKPIVQKFKVTLITPVEYLDTWTQMDAEELHRHLGRWPSRYSKVRELKR